MLNTTQELKDFILWAKGAKLQSFKIGHLEVHFSTLAFIDDAINYTTPQNVPSEEKTTSKTLVDTLPADYDEDDLFYSAKP